VTKRVTIADVARQAGLSKGAVSYALNGQPGVSESTRQRVLRLALEMGWHPNSAAKALSGARAGAIGLVLARPASTLGVESFFPKLISGMESAMASSQTALLLQVVPDHEAEIATYRRWWAERRVDGVFLIDLTIDDDRVPVLEELRLPVMVVGGPGHHGTLPSVWIDDASAMVMVIEYLAALGHRRIARIGGVPGMLHDEMRSAAFDNVVTRLDLEWSTTVPTDYSPEAGAQATRRLLSAANLPTAIVYDNDVMAVAGV
jgi:DNA-binding LacI/PurR family transcriptional regulator